MVYALKMLQLNLLNYLVEIHSFPVLNIKKNTMEMNSKRVLLSKYIEDIYFFEVNTKNISSNAVKKISIFHECVA